MTYPLGPLSAAHESYMHELPEEAVGLCVVVACACGVPAWIYFAAGDEGLGWGCVTAGTVVVLPLLFSCLRNWKSLDKGGKIYRD